MNAQTTTVRLTDEELVALDGHVREKVQTEVAEALARLKDKKGLGAVPDQYRDFVTRVIEEAKSAGKLAFRHKSLRHCNVCGSSAGYAKYKRNSRYHDKGEPNYDKPLTFRGVELADRFITVKGSASLGCCISSCWNEIKPFLGDALKGVKAAIPEKITGYPPTWTWHRNRRCTECGWKGHGGQMMGQRHTECPQCDAGNFGFGPTLVKITDGFSLEVVE